MNVFILKIGLKICFTFKKVFSYKNKTILEMLDVKVSTLKDSI